MSKIIAALVVLVLVFLFVVWSYGVPQGDYEAGVKAAAAAAGPPVPPLPHEKWSFDGPFGTYDRAAVQRGFKVYAEVCQGCHTINLVHYADLGSDGPGGGIGYNEGEVKAFAEASLKKYADTDDAGNAIERAGRPTDTPLPFNFNNDKQAENSYGKVPPDLSVIMRAREGGPDYVFALLGGFHTDKEGKATNDYFPGHNIAMPEPPLSDKPAENEEQRRDIVNFLAWTTDPIMEERKRTGVKVMIFLVVMAGILYLSKRAIWADLH